MGRIRALEPLPDGGWLIGGQHGLYRLPAGADQIKELNKHDIWAIRPVAEGGWLIGAMWGLFRLPAGADQVHEVGGPSLDSAFAIEPIPDGGALIGAAQGLFRLPAGGDAVEAVGGEQSSVDTIQTLSEGGWLIGAGNGLFRLSEGAKSTETVAKTHLGRVRGIKPLTGGDWLVGSSQGVFTALLNIEDAEVRPTANIATFYPSSEPIVTTWTIRHRCAAVADALDMRVMLIPPTDQHNRGTELLRPYNFKAVGQEETTFIVNLALPTPGTWKLQVAGAGTTEPISIDVADSLAARIQRWWARILVAIGVVYVIAFILLFALTHRYGWAFRIIADPVWSKVAVWPYFVLRHWSGAQRWVLEPWFKGVVRATRIDRAFLDVPICRSDVTPIGATTLLERLRDEPKL